MPNLPAEVLDLLDETTLYVTYTVAIATPAPLRWTEFDEPTDDGRLGIKVDGTYYAARHLEVPSIEEADGTSPAELTLTIGNADGAANSLCSDATTFRSEVVIEKLWFTEEWELVHRQIWFLGQTGRAELRGTVVLLPCRADRGAHGRAPGRRALRTILVNNETLAAGAKISWPTVIGGD